MACISRFSSGGGAPRQFDFQGVVSRPPRAFTYKEALALSSVCSARAAEPSLSSVRFYLKIDVDASNGDMSSPRSRQLWCGAAKLRELQTRTPPCDALRRERAQRYPSHRRPTPANQMPTQTEKEKRRRRAGRREENHRSPRPTGALRRRGDLNASLPAKHPRSPRRSRCRRRWSASGP